MRNIHLKMSKEEMLEKFKKYKDATIPSEKIPLRNELVIANLDYAKNIAKNIASYYRIDEEELISAAYLALIKVVEGFDVEKSQQFSAYANKVITRAVLKEVSKIRQVDTKYYYAFYDAQLEVEKMYGREYSSTDEEMRNEIFRLLNQTVKTEDKALVIHDNVSMEDLIDADEKEPIGLTEDDMAEELSNSELRELFNDELSRLNEQQQKVLTLKYGLNGDEPKSQVEIARIMNLSGSRIGQIHDRALHIIRRRGFRKLRPFIYDEKKY